MPKDNSIKKVLVIGSGPIVIGQAAEFDYSGTQACQAIKEEGIEVVLVNSNPATIMTERIQLTIPILSPLQRNMWKRLLKRSARTALLPEWADRPV